MSEHGQGSGQHDNSMNGVYVIVGAIFVVLIVWYVKHTAISAFFLKLWWLESGAIGLFTDRLASMRMWLSSADPSKLTAPNLYEVASDVGYYVRWPMAAILAGLAAQVYRKSPFESCKHIHTRETLYEQEKKLWPAIRAVESIALENADIRRGRWRMPLTEYEFAHYHHLFGEDKTLNKTKAEFVFADQLGELWRGSADGLPDHTKALLAIFSARVAGIKNTTTNKYIADEKIIDLANEYSGGAPDLSWVDGLLAESMASPDVQKIISSHAYTKTILASMLERSRNRGILPSCDFLWLKPVDRGLWYLLNAVGRRAYLAESAGVMAHWLAEKLAKRPIQQPIVFKAVDGLEYALNEYNYQEPK